jgi:hypothetical protein
MKLRWNLLRQILVTYIWVNQTSNCYKIEFITLKCKIQVNIPVQNFRFYLRVKKLCRHLIQFQSTPHNQTAKQGETVHTLIHSTLKHLQCAVTSGIRIQFKGTLTELFRSMRNPVRNIQGWSTRVSVTNTHPSHINTWGIHQCKLSKLSSAAQYVRFYLLRLQSKHFPNNSINLALTGMVVECQHNIDSNPRASAFVSIKNTESHLFTDTLKNTCY